MTQFRRYLTAASLFNRPVIALSTIWAVFVNFIDPANSGDGAYLLRAFSVIVVHAGFFIALWLIDSIAVRHFPSAVQPFALLATLIFLAVGRAFALGHVLFGLNVTEQLIVLPRIAASIANQGAFIALLALGYGLLSESAKIRQNLVATHEQLVALAQLANRERAEQSEQLLTQVRGQLAQALQLDESNTPEQTLAVLRSSIDDVVRPLSRILDADTEHLLPPPLHGRIRIQWPHVLRQMMDVRQLRIVPSLVMFVLPVSASLTSLFPTAFGLLLVFAIPTVLAIAIAFLRNVLCKAGRGQKTLIPVLLLSALPGLALFVPFLPRSYVVPYVIGYFGVLAASFLLPVFAGVAIDQSKQLSEKIRHENQELKWELTRARSVSKQQRKVMSIALHGQVQAALSAAALRLHRAIRDGQDLTEAVAWARSEADQAVSFSVDFAAPTEPLHTTINDITELWSDVCTVKNTMDLTDLASIDADPVCAQVVHDLLIELCMNSVKHGRASEIEISCSFPDERIVELRVSDNGHALSKESIGLGTRILDEGCLCWERTSTDFGTEVRAQLPWQRQL